MQCWLTFVLVTVSSFAVAQTSRTQSSSRVPTNPSASITQAQEQQDVEVTKQDFVGLPRIVSTSLSTFGVRLGMSREETLKALERFYPQVSSKPDKYKTDEVDVTMQSDDWPAVWIHFEQGEIDRIEWGPKMEKHLAGRSHMLLTPAAFTKDSPLRLELLGREDNATPDLDGTSGVSVDTQTFVYGKEGLRLTMTVAEFGSQHTSLTDTRITLTKPARVR
jgi:hypothetical protein